MIRYDTPPPLISGGTVAPATFVKLSTAANKTLLQCVANDPVHGVSQVGTHDFQLQSAALGSAGTTGSEIQYFKDGDYCLVLAGTGGFAAGDWVRSDANGAAVVANVAVDNVAGRALEATTAAHYGLIYLTPQVKNTGPSPFRTLTASGALLKADSGGYVNLNLLTSLTATLPAISTLLPGDQITVVALVAPTSGAGYLVAINAADVATVKLVGNGFTAAAGKGSLNTQATAKAGDLLEVVFNGVDFVVTNVVGTWAREA